MGLEIAYRFKRNEKFAKESIAKMPGAKLFAFFETQKETHLGFLIHGRYHTTPARDNIRDDDYNRMLIEQTAALVSESIPIIKSLGLLDVSFLNAMPIIKQEFEGSAFEPIFGKVAEKLASEEPLLPAEDGE